jgi:hypothetical protein
MRPTFKSAALVCAALALIGVTAASSQGSSPQSAASGTSRPTAVTYKLGHRADVFEFGVAWQLDVEPGLYNASLRATLLLEPGDPDSPSAAICGIVDLNTFGRRYPRIYFAESAMQGQDLPAAVAGSSTVHVTPNMTPGVVCMASTGGLQLFQPVAVTFTSLGKRTYGDSTEIPLEPGKQLRSQLRHLFAGDALAG